MAASGAGPGALNASGHRTVIDALQYRFLSRWQFLNGGSRRSIVQTILPGKVTEAASLALAPRSRANATRLAVALAAQVFQFVLLWPFLLPANPARGATRVLLVLLTPVQWALIHEAIHGSLLGRRTANDLAGRLLSTFHGAPFRVLRLGHLLHHQHSRCPRERSEVYDARSRSWWRAALPYYLWLLGGLYVTELALGQFLLLPKVALRRLERSVDGPNTVAGLLLRGLRQPGALSEARADALATALTFGVASLLYGVHLWMLAIALLARAFFISFADNAYHYGTVRDAPRQARNLRLPAPLQVAMLNFTLHGTHHRHPAAPWHCLPLLFREEAEGWDGGYLRTQLRQLRGPLPLDRLPVAAPRPLDARR